MVRQLFDDIYYVGACDKSKALFENLFPLPEGMRYNSYLIRDEKTALLDAGDESVREEFFCNLEDTLQGDKLDYLVIHHVEPDHSALVNEVLRLHPETKIVTSAMALKFLNQFSGCDYTDKTQCVKEGDTLSLGKHSLQFLSAPMVHWPEVLVSYDAYAKTLFSADGFGAFGSSEGSVLVSDLVNAESWADEARRYYTNIVGKFGGNVATLLKKAAAFDVQKICPLHGLVFNENAALALKYYQLWSSYTPENEGVLIVYGSMYGNTKRAADLLAAKLAQKGKLVKSVEISKIDFSYIVADTFRFRNLVFACPTYYGGMFPKMEQFLALVKKTALANRRIAFMENGTWAATSGKLMKEALSTLNADFSLPCVSLKSALDAASSAQLDALANAL